MPASEPSSVTELLQRARDNVPGDVERLFATCRDYLGFVARAHVERKLAAKFDASDIVQQTLLEAYRDFPNFRGKSEGEWLAWLRQILTRNAANHVRQFRATGKRELARETPTLCGDGSSAAPGPALVDRGESPSQCLVRQERDLQIADALARLPEDYREVVILRNLQRLPFQDVAERMGRSRPAVQMLWGRAIAQLQMTFVKDRANLQ